MPSIIESRLIEKIREKHHQLEREGELLSKAELEKCYNLFKQKFGPDALSRLDGEDILDVIHNHGNHDSLVYWLEFKNDDEFPTTRFGGIGGGSASKFGIFRRAGSEEWITGSSINQQVISLEEAVKIAKKHRSQLIKGVEILAKVPQDANEDDYRNLQNSLLSEAPDVADRVWGRKYFSLLSPNILDDYHNPEWQKFHLLKLLIPPPEDTGRYLASFHFVAIARTMDIPLNHLTTTLKSLNGNPHQYWRVGTRLGGTKSIWESMRDGGFVAVGWAEIEDLSSFQHKKADKETLKKQMSDAFPNWPPQTIGKQTQQLFNFVTAIKKNDIVLASDGMRVLGIGRITGDHEYVAESEFPNRRPVEWLNLKEWQIPHREGLQTTVHEMKKYPANIIQAERILLENTSGNAPSVAVSTTSTPPERLSGIPGNIQCIIERKKQVILYGPPGTGKTYLSTSKRGDGSCSSSQFS